MHEHWFFTKTWSKQQPSRDTEKLATGHDKSQLQVTPPPPPPPPPTFPCLTLSTIHGFLGRLDDDDDEEEERWIQIWQPQKR